jgi:ferredoxin-NADP reductase
VIRSYWLSSIAGEDGYRMSVKLEPHGVGSEFLHEHVHEDDVIDVAAPRGSFLLRDYHRPVVLISAGIGATPVVAMLEALARAGSTRDVWWLHGARNSEEQAFGQEVDHLLGSVPHHHRLVAYSQPLPTDVPGSGFDTTGRLKIETIEAFRVPVDADYYLCGPDAFMRTISPGSPHEAYHPSDWRRKYSARPLRLRPAPWGASEPRRTSRSGLPGPARR